MSRRIHVSGFIVLTLFLAFFAFLMLAGCGTNDGVTPRPSVSGAESPPGSDVKPDKQQVILATTTSTYDSGLLDELLPEFERGTGYMVKPIALGTGQALIMASRGEADVLLVHAPDAERELVEARDVINRRLVMHNDFVIVGPQEDPAGIKGMTTAAGALKEIARAGQLFVSRGDDSGTHKKEKELWQAAGLEPAGEWYQEAGQGMGQTLNIASEKGAYTVTDRGTFLALQKNLRVDVLVEGDATLFNVYHVMQVNPSKSEMINAGGAAAFADFMVARETQEVIGKFGVDRYGQPLFVPDAGKPERQ